MMITLRRLLLCLVLCISVTVLSAQTPDTNLYSVAFYNLENLFDTIHDVGKNDADFLPDGKYRWNTYKYESKLKNMARVLGELGRDQLSQGPAFIGVAEVENEHVLSDLTKQEPIRNYKFIHHEGPDKRGIDCALLYDPQQFKVNHSVLIPSIPFKGDTTHLTRGFLIVDGHLAGDHIAVIVNHWPSRGAQEEVRLHAARQVKHLKDSLVRTDKRLKLILMGDFNDDPMDASLKALGQKKYAQKTKKRDLFNPWWETLEDKGIGTLYYRGKWNLFDQIIFNGRLLKSRKGLVYAGHEVFKRDYMIEASGRYAGSPIRTHGGRKWLNGYSDHLPTIIYLKKR